MKKLLILALALFAGSSAQAKQPNIVLVFVDDMGWEDFSCFGNQDASTPNIDALAEEGLRFHQFYVNSPICSPSRVAISTGQYPQRWRITSFLNDRQSNNERGVAQWLDPKAPMLARQLQQAGYATGHFGKWHMGGQRDVDTAPPIAAYGFDESLTNFEGMGAKLLPLTEQKDKQGNVVKGRIWDDAENLGEPVTWMLRSEITGGFVEPAIAFIDKAQASEKPFYINLWPDDVHGPFFPSVERWSQNRRERYLAVLEEMDAQFKTLFDRVRNDPKLRENTLVLICSDNGPAKGAGSAGPFKGYKTHLFEGGVRSSMVIWGPGLMDESVQGTVNKSSVFSAIDLAPSLLELAGISTSAKFDGEDLSGVLVGKSKASREAPIFFRRPPDRKSYYGLDNLPDLSMRLGEWKLLCDYGGEQPKLFNMEMDIGEEKNLASEYPEVVERMVKAIRRWNSKLPKDAGDPTWAENEAAGPSIKAAFASVQRNGKPYKTFYNNYISPHAVLEKDIVFTAHQDGQGRPVIDAYDIKKNTWHGPVRASNFGLGADTHGNPSIAIDAKGHLHVFFGCHTGAMKHVRSAAPYDIGRWVAMPSPTPRATYPQSMRMADGSIYLFYRAGGHVAPWSLRVSKDDGQSWTEQQPVIEMRRDFPDKKACSYNAFVPGIDGKTVHCFWVYKDDNPRGNKRKYQGMHEAVYRYNMYYAKRTAGGQWIAADGTAMSDLPVNKTFCDKHAMFVDSGEEFTAPKRIVIGQDDTPYIRVRQGVTDWKRGKVFVPYQYRFACPVEGKWQVHDEMPNQWPDLVKRLILSAGPAAFGGGQTNKWFIHYEEGPPEDAKATYVWLGHIEKGYAIRQDGPAKSPEK